MPANRNSNINPQNSNNNNNNNSPTSPNATSFFSTFLSTNGRQPVPLRSSTSASASASNGGGSWIISELQQAQQQIQRTLQSVDSESSTRSLDPAATPFYLHPRQSTHADLLEMATAAPQSPISAIFSPQTIQAARESSADELIESYLEAAMSDDAETEFDGAETERERAGERDAFLRSASLHPLQPLNSTGTINPINITNNLPLQLQQVLRNASSLHNSSVQHLRASVRGTNPGNSALRNKIVYRLKCVYCTTAVCDRAMRAILLADTKIELYSTDIPPRALKTMDEDRLTQGCNCRIRDTVCTGCGNVLGYHVSQPCDRCLDARNNGHFWMFYSEGVCPAEQKDLDGSGPLFWASLTPMCEFVPASTCARPGISGNNGQDTLCR